MLSRLSSSRRSSLSLHLVRHFSIRVSSLRKGNLAAKLLRRDASPNPSKSIQKGGLVDKQARLGVALKLPVLENGRQQDLEGDACCNGIVKLSVKSRKKIKEVLSSDGAVKLDDKKTYCSGGAVKLSVTDDKKTYYSDEKTPCDTQRFQTDQARYADAQLSQIEIREAHLHHTPTNISVESQVITEEGHHSQTSISKAETEERDEEKNAVSTHFQSLKPSVPSLARETCKQVKVRKENTDFVVVHSVIIKWKVITDEFLQDLHQKIDLLLAESAPLTQVQALLKKKAFLSASPDKVAAVLKVLKEFFESSDKACEILTQNAGIISQPLEQLEQRLQVLTQFQVDKETCHWLGTRCNMMMTTKVESYQSSLTFLKELGLGAESRNKILRRGYGIHLSQSNMQSSLDFFVSIGITGPKLLKLVERRPRIFGASVNNNLMVKHNFFQQMGFSAEQFVSAMGHISQCSNGKIFLQYNFFIKELGIPHEDVIKIFRQQPSVLGRSTEDVKAKLHFLLHTLNRDISEAVKFPAYFSCSLKGRILPRFKVLEGLSLPKSPPLACVLARNTSRFRTYFKIPDSVDCM